MELQDLCGLPFGVVAQPLARPGDGQGPAASSGGGGASCWASELARCARCLGYINALCDVDARAWTCSLCGCGNDFSTAASLRR